MEERTNIRPGLEEEPDLSAPERAGDRSPDLPPMPPRPPHGPHGPHGRHFPGPPPMPPAPPMRPMHPFLPPPPLRNILESRRYADLDTEGRILALLRELGRMGRVGPDGRGGQGRILRLLARTGPMAQRELTELLGIQPGSASELLAKLERAGLVTRAPSETDRRSALVSLTDAGAARASQLSDLRPEDALLLPLDAQERETLLALLEKLYSGSRSDG